MKACKVLSSLWGISAGFFFFPSVASCTLSGNPGEPGLLTHGIIWEEAPIANLRVGFFGDYVYNQTSQDTFPKEGEERETYDMQLWTQASIITLNIRNWIDIYGILGGLRIQNNGEIFTPQEFAWGVGSKIVFLHLGRWRAGCDVKYFQSEQKPQFFQCNNLAYNVTSNFYFLYREIQAALGLSYRTHYVSPYVSASYISTELSPTPSTVFLRIPSRNRETRLGIKSVSNANHFGLILGATLIDVRKASLSLEWRVFNQNSIDLSGEIRF